MTVLRWAAAVYLMALVAGHALRLGHVRRHHVESASFIFAAVLVVTVAVRRQVAAQERLADAADRSPSMLFAAALLAGGFVIYAPVISAGLFADDFVLLDAARQGRWTVWTELFRPVIFPVWRGLDRISADVAVSLHLLNITLHTANAVMTAALARRLGLSTWSGAVAGALFLIFPASVEPVAWPAGVQDVLMTSFALAFLVLLTSPRLTVTRVVAVVALLLAACLTKESGFTAMALAALVCAAVRARRQAWIALGVAAAAAAVLMVARVSLLPVPAAYRGIPSRYHAKELLVRPFATLVLPLSESELTAYPWLPVLLAGLVVIGLCLAATRWQRGSHGFRLVLMGAAFVLASIAAASSIFYIDANLLGSRYLYLGSAGWVILLATVHRDVMSRSSAIGGLFALVVVVSWTAATRAHVMTWKRAAAQRELILIEAEKAALPGCGDTVVEGLPQAHHGVPLFVNGFPEAMRARIPDARFRIGSADGEQAACRIVWTGAEFRSQ